jgi:hypothetical protein
MNYSQDTQRKYTTQDVPDTWQKWRHVTLVRKRVVFSQQIRLTAGGLEAPIPRVSSATTLAFEGPHPNHHQHRYSASLLQKPCASHPTMTESNTSTKPIVASHPAGQRTMSSPPEGVMESYQGTPDTRLTMFSPDESSVTYHRGGAYTTGPGQAYPPGKSLF